MKRKLSILLAFCMIFALTAQLGAAGGAVAYAATYTPEEFERLQQAAEGGDAAAMAELGSVYYLGSYKSGISRDFNLALQWFLKAADAGNKDVLFNIAAIYEKGSTGEKNLDKAYSWYKQAAEAGNKDAAQKLEDKQFETFRWKDNARLLTGKLGEYVTIGNRWAYPLYLDAPVVDCTLLTMELRVVDHTGWPFGRYAVYGLDADGSWKFFDYFQIEQFQGEGEARTYSFQFDTPVSFRGLAICLAEDGMWFDLTIEPLFYVDAAYVSQYSETLPAPVFTPVDKEYPELSSTVSSSPYVNPYG